jgi:hypothetical protein
MTQIKTFYNLNNLDLRELNFILGQITDRIDKLEGLRGTPHFYANVNAGGNKIQNVEPATQSAEALTYDYLTNFGDAAYKNVGSESEDVAPGNSGVTNGDSHDHAGGDGAPIHHGGLTGLTDPDHTEASLALSNVTTNDVTITRHGFCPIAPNDTDKFLSGDATWRDAIPAGAIVGWSGYLDDCPAGWLVCDGSSGTPDLTGSFIV